MKVNVISFKILPDGTKVIKGEKEIEIKRENSKRQNKRSAKNNAAPTEAE